MAENLGNLMDCPICLERLTDPKFLPCHHTFCCKCIQSLCSNNGVRACPLCRLTFTVPDGCCSKLRTNPHAEELAKLSQELETKTTRVMILNEQLSAVTVKLEESEATLQEQLTENFRVSEKLTETTAKLAELQDVSPELEKQLRWPLEEEGITAERKELYLRIGLKQIAALKKELKTANTQLRRKDASLKKVVGKKLRLNIKLAEATAKLAELELSFSEVQKLLESRDKELNTAKAREELLRKQQKETIEELKDAKRCHDVARIEFDNCRRSWKTFEESLKRATLTNEALCMQLETVGLLNKLMCLQYTSQLRELKNVDPITRLTEALAMNIQRQNWKWLAKAAGVLFGLFALMFLATICAVTVLKRTGFIT